MCGVELPAHKRICDLDIKILQALQTTRRAARPVALVTWLASGEQRLLEQSATLALQGDLGRAVAGAFGDDRSRVLDVDGQSVFVHVYNPPLRLAVVGAVHIAQHLVPMAQQLGYQVTVIDPRRSFASAARFPGVALDTDWPDEAMQRFEPDARTGLITLTHDPKLDDPALHVALASSCFYIGCLGSRRTHDKRLQRLRDAGFDDNALARIHGPLGLDLGGRSPPEIALSALAQMTSALRGGRVR